MKPITQTILNGDVTNGEETGNCFAACIASIFELPLEEVPNFSWIGRNKHPDSDSAPVLGSGDWWYYLRDWLAARGLMYFDMAIDGTPPDILRSLGYHVMTGKSPRGDWHHSVVGYRGEIVHDPHPDRSGLRSAELFGVFVQKFDGHSVITAPAHALGVRQFQEGSR